MFNDLKLGKKIGLGFSLVLILLASVATISLLGMNKANNGIEQYRESVTDTNLVEILQSRMLMVRLAVRGYVDTPNEADRVQYKQNINELYQKLEDALIVIKTSNRLTIINHIKSLIKNYDFAFQEFVTKSGQLADAYNQELVPHGELMRDAVDKLITHLSNSHNQKALLNAVELQRQMLVGRLFVVKYFESNKEDDYNVAKENMGTALTNRIKILAKSIDTDEARKLFNQFSQGHNAYLLDMQHIYDFAHKKNVLVSNSLAVIGNQVAELAEKIKIMVLAEQEALGPELEKNTYQSILSTEILSLAAIIIGISASIMLSKRITGPISQAVLAANQLAQGDLTVNIPANSKDETGILLEAIQNTATKLREMIGTITQSSIELASASEELAVVTEQTSKGIMRQETETDSVATSMNEMATTVHDVASNASKASSAASQADKEAMSGTMVVDMTIKSINALHDNVNNSSHKLENVEKQVENISSILNVIKGIADQTNLLALNAAIEAARAGEQGRGFAVVADEVRSLASRTQNSTGEIQQIIAHLQAGTKLTVETMNEGKAQAITCVDQAEQTNAALAAITGAIELINDMNFQIASASEQQSIVAETINKNVENVKRIAQENATGATQTMGSSREIAKLAERLNQLVVQFNI